MTLRVLGIDPGLTRCGVGVVEVDATRRATLVAVTVIRSPADMPLEQRLLTIGRGIEQLVDEHRPDAMAIERVFAQNNLSTVMGTAQVSGLALRAAHELPSGGAAPSPEGRLLEAEARAELLGALERLADDDRLVLSCRYLLELGEAETAEVLGLRRGTVKSRTSRALERLRTELGERG